MGRLTEEISMFYEVEIASSNWEQGVNKEDSRRSSKEASVYYARN